jgi:hypothetical protein
MSGDKFRAVKAALEARGFGVSYSGSFQETIWVRWGAPGPHGGMLANAGTFAF